MGISDQSVRRIVAKHGGKRGALMLAHAGRAGARFPRCKRLLFGPHVTAERGGERRRDFALAERRVPTSS